MKSDDGDVRLAPNSVGRTDISTGALDRKIVGAALRAGSAKIKMLFAHLKRILELDRLRLLGPDGARDEFTLAATAQNLRKIAKLIPIPA